jgi:hypothetical protein
MTIDEFLNLQWSKLTVDAEEMELSGHILVVRHNAYSSKGFVDGVEVAFACESYEQTMSRMERVCRILYTHLRIADIRLD